MPRHGSPGVPYESAESLGRTFAAAVGCDTAGDPAACMRAKSVGDVLSAAPRVTADLLVTSAHYLPNIDGSTFPVPAWAALQAGRLNARTWMGGANHDEGIAFALVRVQIVPIQTEADYESAVNAILPAHASDVVALYPAAAFGGPVVAYAF